MAAAVTGQCLTSFVVNLLCRRRRRRCTSTLLLAVGLFVVIFFLFGLVGNWSSLIDQQQQPPGAADVDWEAEYERARRQSLREHMSFYVDDGRLRPVPGDRISRDRCPACFGLDLCDAVDKQELRVDTADTSPAAAVKGVYRGRWHDIPIAVRRLADRKPFRLFDEFVCRDATGNAACDVTSAILSNRSLVQRVDVDAFSVGHLRRAWKIAHGDEGPLALTYTLCLTSDMVDQFRQLYSGGTRRPLTAVERAVLFTSMVVHPETMMIQFLKQSSSSDRLAPHVYGSCGRLVVVEHGGRPLYNAINMSFAERAELSLQLISLLRALWHADPKWFALYSHINYGNVAVSHHGQVYLTDYKHLSIIQNANYHSHDDQLPDYGDDNYHDDGHRHDNNNKKAAAADSPVESVTDCNDDCFQSLLTSLSSTADDDGKNDDDNDDRVGGRHDDVRASKLRRQRQDKCRTLHDVSGPFMYSLLCRNILADESRDSGLRGLLHDVPDDEDMSDRRERIEAALGDCINKSAPKKRLEAVETLSEILSVYTGLRLE